MAPPLLAFVALICVPVVVVANPRHARAVIGRWQRVIWKRLDWAVSGWKPVLSIHGMFTLQDHLLPGGGDLGGGGPLPTACVPNPLDAPLSRVELAVLRIPEQLLP